MIGTRVRKRSRTIILGVLCVAWLASGQAMSGYAEVAVEPSYDAYVDTVREGLAHRTSLVSSISGAAEIEYTFSPENCERSRGDAEEYAKEIKWIGVVLPLDSTHRSHMDFSADFDKEQWRCDVTDSTVSGHNLWASTNDPALNRHLPASTFRRVAVCDAAKKYDHHYGLDTGWIESYGGRTWEVPQPLVYVQTLARGVSSSVSNILVDPRYVVVFEGEEEVGGHTCLKIHVSPKDVSLGGKVITFWSAPALDFAVVREEYHSYRPAGAPDEEPARELTWIKVASDFVKASDILWCPRSSEATCYRYGPEDPQGTALWEYTRVLRLKSIAVNAPLPAIEPYQFPQGTKVIDHTQRSVTVVGEGDG